MSTRPRIDLLGLAELDPQLARDAGLLADDEGEATGPSFDARVESRRAFVEMKQLFMRAVENLAHRKGAWLRSQVRSAEDPVDLWLLRGPLLSALREDDLATRTMRAALYRALDRGFPHGAIAAAPADRLARRP